MESEVSTGHVVHNVWGGIAGPKKKKKSLLRVWSATPRPPFTDKWILASSA